MNYKEYNTTAECLKSIRCSTYPNYEVIVIDNESKPEELNLLMNEFKSFRFISSKENLYYAEGNNLGIDNANGEFVVLLNNDTTVTPSWLEPLVQIANKESMAFYQPKILFMDNPLLVNSLGNTMNIFGFAYPIGIGIEDKDLNSPEEIFYCSGACIFTSRDVIKKIGKLDSNFYTYYEDVNWGWRGQLIGIRSYVVPTSIIYHKWGGSYSSTLTGKKLYFLERGRVSSVLRNFSSKTISVLLPSLILIDIALMAYTLKRGLLKYKILAMRDVLKNLKMIINERQMLQSQRTVDDANFFHLISKEINHPYLQSSTTAKKFLDSIGRFCFKLL